jgi:hypothetical protein
VLGPFHLSDLRSENVSAGRPIDGPDRCWRVMGDWLE